VRGGGGTPVIFFTSNGEPPMTDQTLQRAVMDELEWEPSINAAHIGVTANNGAVTLTGHVDSYMERSAAERAAGRVNGVKAVVEELEVRYPFDTPDDDDIVKSAIDALSWDLEVPKNKVTVKVEKGWITLSGTVDWYFQRNAAAADVRKLRGVVGMTNDIDIKPTVQASNVQAKIKAAFARNAQIDADNIRVTANGGKVTLMGNVDSWYERSLAEDTAWSAPGVTQVEDRLIIS
jgi:osmotically-inducible protein OsmY